MQGAVSEHLAMLERCGVEPVAVKSPEGLKQVNGLILPGGESTTIGKLIRIFGMEEEIVRRSKDGSLAVFGTCAGMVLLAGEIIDGLPDQPGLKLMDTKVRRNAFGRQRESFESSVRLKLNQQDQELEAVFIRAPVIVEAGPKVEVLSALEEGIIAAREGNLLATSFHPELGEDLSVHKLFIAMVDSLS